MVKSSIYLIKALRPRQWLKNLAVFASIVFSGKLFVGRLLYTSLIAFIAFCCLSSSNYLLNDVLDAPSDRKHPFKKFRPVASGKLSPKIALITALILGLLGLYLSYSINLALFLVAIIFITLAVSYSILLKHFSVVDVLTITIAYFLRVYAGEAATGYHLSVWLTLTVISLSLFLAIGKRRSELTLIQGYKGVIPQQTRKTLVHYSEKLLDVYTAMFANSTWITYCFYTFLEKPPQSLFAYREYLIDLFPPERKWLMLTIPFVLYGIMRYMQLIYEGRGGEAPEKVLTSDIPLLTTVIGWAFAVVIIMYGLGG